jgi:sporulation protein YlmC with PRC-barrel domain
MRATELLGCAVHDGDGEPIGNVHDLRFNREQADPWSTCRLTAIAVGPVAVGPRFGYGSGDMAGPWPLSALFNKRHQRHSLIIEWAEVIRVDRPRIDVRSTRAELSARQERR